MTFLNKHFRLISGLAFALLLLAMFSCNVTTEDGHTYLNIKNDTAWAKFDTLEITWFDSTTSKGGVLFRGKPEDLKDINKFQVDGYQGGKIEVTFKGINGTQLVYEEKRGFDGATPATSTKRIVLIQPPDSIPHPKPNPPRITDFTADSIISIGDSASFSAYVTLDSGSLKSFAWNYEGGDAFAPATSISGKTATLKGGHRYLKAGSYTAEVKVISEVDSIAVARIHIDVVVDSPVCDAGRDITVFTNGTIRLHGTATDAYGHIVKTEWRIGSSPFAIAPLDTAFAAPVTPQELTALLLVTDDDGQTGLDSLKIHVISENESNLTGLGVSKGRLVPEFDPTILAYTDTVPYKTESIILSPTGSGSIKVNAFPVVSGDSSKDIDLKVGNNTITTSVQFGETKGKIYSLTVYRHPVSENAELSALVVSAGPLDTSFTSADTSYVVNVPNTTISTTIRAKLSDTTSTLTINDFSVASNAQSGAINLAVGPNTVFVEVTSQSGEKKIYRIQINKAGNGNADLAALLLSAGNIAPNFNAGTTDYALSVTNDVQSTKVTVTTANEYATLTINDFPVKSNTPADIQLGVGATSITIKVTAQNGTEKSYKVQVTRAGNGNADLSGLTVAAGAISPSFSPDAVFYSLAVANSVDSTTITATVGIASSSLAIDKNAIASGSNTPVKLKVGVNSISVVVSAQNGEKKTYTVVITRAGNGDAELSGITISGDTLSPHFSRTTFAYSMSVKNEISIITIHPQVSAATSTFSMTANAVAIDSASLASPIPLHVGNNTIEITVKAESGAEKKYAIKISRAPNDNADLSNLSVSAGPFDTAFAPARISYSAHVGNNVLATKVTPTSSSPTSVDSVYEKAVASGTASESIELKVGPNPITVVVVAENGAKKTYTIVITREGRANADLSSLSISVGVFDKAFTPGNTLYQVSLPNNSPSITLTGVVADTTATLAYIPSATVNLITGLNPISVEVTAQNKTKKVYNIQVTCEKSGDADLSNLTVSPGTLIPVFQKLTTDYFISVLNSISTVTITPTVSSSVSKITVNGLAQASGAASGVNVNVGDNPIPVVVTAENGTVKTYNVLVKRANDNPVVSGLKDTTLSINDAVTFNVNATDPQGIKWYLWDFNGDGVNDDTTIGSSKTHVFPGTPQVVPVIVTVQDNLGGITKSNITVTVVQDSPVVKLGNDTNVATGRQIHVKGTATDKYGTIKSLEWSFDGGPFKPASAPDTTFSAPLTQNLDYRVIVKATDDDGNVASDTVVAIVEKITLVTVGEGGLIATSPDYGVSWVHRKSNTPYALRSVVWNGSLMVAVGNWGVTSSSTSTDGITWSNASIQAWPLYSVVWTGTLFVAAGGYVQPPSYDWAYIHSSPDGINWTERFSKTGGGASNALVWTGTSLVAVGDRGNILTSPDGITWTQRVAGTHHNSVTWTGSQLVTVGYNGTILTSPDGITWISSSSGTTNTLLSVTWMGSQLVAVGQSGIILTSPDGITWTPRSSGTGNGLNSVAWTGSQLVAVGDGGTILASTDGISWTKLSSGTTLNLRSVTRAGN